MVCCVAAVPVHQVLSGLVEAHRTSLEANPLPRLTEVHGHEADNGKTIQLLGRNLESREAALTAIHTTVVHHLSSLKLGRVELEPIVSLQDKCVLIAVRLGVEPSHGP